MSTIRSCDCSWSWQHFYDLLSFFTASVFFFLHSNTFCRKLPNRSDAARLLCITVLFLTAQGGYLNLASSEMSCFLFFIRCGMWTRKLLCIQRPTPLISEMLSSLDKFFTLLWIRRNTSDQICSVNLLRLRISSCYRIETIQVMFYAHVYHWRKSIQEYKCSQAPYDEEKHFLFKTDYCSL